MTCLTPPQRDHRDIVEKLPRQVQVPQHLVLIMHVCHRAPAVQRGVRCWPSTGAACLQRSLASSFRLPIAAMASSAGHYAIPTDLSGFMKRIEENNKGAEQVSSLVPFKVGGKEVGAMKRDG